MFGSIADGTSTVAPKKPGVIRIGVGIATGLLGGAIIGGAIASSPYYYGPGYRPYGYYGGPAYVADDPYGGGCVWQRQRFWDGYGWRFRRVRVCG